MILAIKHRTIYYRRFAKDIWGIVRTTAPQPWSDKHLNYKLNHGQVSDSEKKLIFKFQKLQRLQIPHYLTFNNSLFARSTHGIQRILDFFFTLYMAKKKQNRQKNKPYVYRLDIIDRPLIRKKLKQRFVSLRLVKLFYINYSYKNFRQLAMRMRRQYGMFEWNFLLQLEGRLMSFLYRTSLISNPFQCMQFIKQGYVMVNLKYIPHTNYRVQVSDFVSFSYLGKKIVYLALMYRLKNRLTLFNAPNYMFVSYTFMFSYMKRPPLKKQLVFPIAIDLYRATGYAF